MILLMSQNSGACVQVNLYGACIIGEESERNKRELVQALQNQPRNQVRSTIRLIIFLSSFQVEFGVCSLKEDTDLLSHVQEVSELQQ